MKLLLFFNEFVPKFWQKLEANSPFYKSCKAHPATPVAAKSSRSKDWRTSYASFVQRQSPQTSYIQFPTSFLLAEYNNLERNVDQDVAQSLKYACYKIFVTKYTN